MPRKKRHPEEDIGAQGRSRGRRTRKSTIRKPVWLYFDEDEHELVHVAASIEGDSASSFGAKAVLDRAYDVIRRYQARTGTHDDSPRPSVARETLESLRGRYPVPPKR